MAEDEAEPEGGRSASESHVRGRGKATKAEPESEMDVDAVRRVVDERVERTLREQVGRMVSDLDEKIGGEAGARVDAVVAVVRDLGVFRGEIKAALGAHKFEAAAALHEAYVKHEAALAAERA